MHPDFPNWGNYLNSNPFFHWFKFRFFSLVIILGRWLVGAQFIQFYTYYFLHTLKIEKIEKKNFWNEANSDFEIRNRNPQTQKSNDKKSDHSGPDSQWIPNQEWILLSRKMRELFHWTVLKHSMLSIILWLRTGISGPQSIVCNLRWGFYGP